MAVDGICWTEPVVVAFCIMLPQAEINQLLSLIINSKLWEEGHLSEAGSCSGSTPRSESV
jgi:hypothetical protein